MSFLSETEILFGALLALVIAMIVLLVLQLRNSASVQKLSAPVYEYVLHQAEEEAKKIIVKAKEESRKLIEATHEEQEKILTTYKQAAEKMQAEYRAHLKEHTQDLSAKIDAVVHVHKEELKRFNTHTEQAVTTTKEHLEHSLQTLTTEIDEAKGQIHSHTASALVALDSSINDVAETFKERIQNYDGSIEAIIHQHHDVLTKKLDEEMATYREARERMLDAHLEQIIEAITKRVLHKQLTITEHADLVRQALERAKRDGIWK